MAVEYPFKGVAHWKRDLIELDVNVIRRQGLEISLLFSEAEVEGFGVFIQISNAANVSSFHG